ncbi:MAG: ATP-binding cassette domain-containing protein [Cardiobacteriaceae bacterium]|nr:ATP-binding cassette domain-containing protein [Cardiobacteriaceae bacterium]
MTDTVLTATNLHFAYQSKGENLTILSGTDLHLQRGETVAVVGASGMGKSTLLHILAGLDTPQQGEITLCGHNLSQANDSRRTRLRNQHMGFVYQFHHLLPEFSALENVAMPLLIRGERQRQAQEKAGVLLAAVGLQERVNHRPAELSGGERQRAAIARALVNRPDCLLADEPTGNLDQENAAQAFVLMKQLIAEQNGAMIIVTHDMNLARQMDRCLYLASGKLSDVAPAQKTTE